MENYFIIHGSFSSPYSNWIEWLHDFIEADTIATEQVLIPNAGHINSESGYDTFEDIVVYL